eukprot:jgi/Ulvmu1/4317/UM002_0039.1
MAARIAQTSRICGARCPLSVRPVSRTASVAAAAQSDDKAAVVAKSAALSAVAAQMFMAGQASAAQEISSMAGDNRLGILAVVFLPVIGWVLFNIAGPALNQVNNMADKNKSLIAGAGLGAALLSAGSADAAEEVMTMAGDNRFGILAVLLLPVVGWVLFNIAGPALNQVNSMADKNKSLIAGAGLGAALVSAGQADAAQEMMTVAGDNRLGILAVVFLPVIGWVLFNIAGPALNQVNNMADKNK